MRPYGPACILGAHTHGLSRSLVAQQWTSLAIIAVASQARGAVAACALGRAARRRGDPAAARVRAGGTLLRRAYVCHRGAPSAGRGVPAAAIATRSTQDVTGSMLHTKGSMQHTNGSMLHTKGSMQHTMGPFCAAVAVHFARICAADARRGHGAYTVRAELSVRSPAPRHSRGARALGRCRCAAKLRALGRCGHWAENCRSVCGRSAIAAAFRFG